MAFYVSVDNRGPLLDATFQLISQIADNGDVEFSPSRFSIIASHPSLRFTVILQISPLFFNEYFVNQNHNSRISLRSFHDAMLEGSSLSSMIIRVVEDNMNQMDLIFKSPRLSRRLQQALQLSPAQEDDVGEVKLGKYFSIHSGDLRRIIDQLPLFQDVSLCVTITNSHIMFSTATNQIILAKEEREYEMVDFEEEIGSQFKIILNPVPFFLTLSHNEEERIWFYKTTNNSHVVMIVPVFRHVSYEIYYPQM